MNIKTDALEDPPAGWPNIPEAPAPESIYDVLLMFFMDNREHLGEIKAIKAMWHRAFEKVSLQNA